MVSALARAMTSALSAVISSSELSAERARSSRCARAFRRDASISRDSSAAVAARAI